MSGGSQFSLTPGPPTPAVIEKEAAGSREPQPAASTLTIISLPWPAKELSPNYRSRTHHAKTRATKAARQEAWALTLQAMGCAPVGKLLTVTFNPPDRRKRDDDNMIASTKALRDGIADALGCDDHTFRPDYRFGNVHPGGRVVVEIGEASE